ncbi:type II toxin-antitoxin system ParD family antitoxin [Pantoea sp. LMR881]|uniref:type II toxin-antitoxin system ParD family antitoxin n=1 Tax=Pantoea sp. LMR881 TaxID=3014336 RepID=UPI0022AEC3FF|nr:type II toxin-antitoxin system ParD family antitoxin [Pantoea sp. LMR881]MCZ4059681.1 type II toxin-antitoxin system ParD family antitoxin [Pantoea sp. LMR881]
MARTMTIDLGNDLREFVESLVGSGDYRTQSDVVRDSLRLLREKHVAPQPENLKALLKAGLESGEPEEWDREAFLKMVNRAGMHDKENEALSQSKK